MKLQFGHWFNKPNECHHGPQTWGKYQLFSPKFYKVMPYASDHHYHCFYRLWIYTRWWAFNFDVFIMKKQPVSK